MIDLTTLEVFEALADEGSMTAAAVLLNVNASTITRKIDALEGQLHARLVDRSTRSIKLTEAGLAFLRHVKVAFGQIASGISELEKYQKAPVGALRVHIASSVGQQPIAEHLQQFMQQYPQLRISMKTLYSAPRLDAADFDIALRIGVPSEERAVVRLLAHLKTGLLASPAYAAQHLLLRVGAANDAKELALATFNVDANVKAMTGLNGVDAKAMIGTTAIETEGAKVGADLPDFSTAIGSNFSTTISSNDPQAIVRMIASGGTAGRMSYWMASEAICRGELVDLAPDLQQSVALYAVLPAVHGMPEKTRLFLRFLEQSVVPDLKRREALALEFLGQQTSDPVHS